MQLMYRSSQQLRWNRSGWTQQPVHGSLQIWALQTLFLHDLLRSRKKVTYVIMMQPISQAVQVLFLPRCRSFKVFQDLVGKLVRGWHGRLFLPELIHLSVDSFEYIDLISDNLLVDHAATAADNGIAFIFRLQKDFQCFNPLRQVGSCQKGRLAFQHCIANKNNLFIWQHDPDGARRWTGTALQQNRRITPMDDHSFDKGNFRWRPAHTSQTGDGFPIRTGFLALGLERGGAIAKGLGCLLMSDDRAIHGADSKSTVWMGVQINEYP